MFVIIYNYNFVIVYIKIEYIYLIINSIKFKDFEFNIIKIE